MLAPVVCCLLIAAADAQEPASRVINAHRDLIRCIEFSPDGKSFATASFDGSVQIRDAASGELLKTLSSHRGKVYWASYSRDGRTFASGGDDAVVRLWNLDTGEARTEFRGHQAIAWTGAVTPDGMRVVSGGPDANVFVWDVATGKAERTFRHAAPVWWIDVSHDSRTAAIAGGDGKVTLYELATGKAQRSFGDHAGGVYCVRFSPDDSLIATAGADARAKVWNANSGALTHTLPQFGAVFTVAFSPDSKELATGGEDYSIRLWSAERGTFHSKRTGHVDAVWSAAFAPDGSNLASAGSDGNVLLCGLDDPPNAPADRLPARVDLRPTLKKFGLPVVAQGARNTCSVQTFTRALEFAVSKHEGRGIRLSDEYLNWACNQVIGNTGPTAADRGQFFEHLWMGYCKHGICRAQLMPFQRKFDHTAQPPAPAAKDVAEMRQHTLVWHDITGPGVPDAAVVSQAKSVLANGWPLLAGSAHSLFVVGYVDARDGGFFIVGDSGAGTYIDRVTGDRLHTAISYARVKDYGFSWIECVGPSKPETRR